MLQFEELLQLLLCHLVTLELDDVGVAKVDHVHVERMYQSLVVRVHGPLRDGEERVLTDVVLEPEVAPLLGETIAKRILRGEEVA